jgi:hypothetical protein
MPEFDFRASRRLSAALLLLGILLIVLSWTGIGRIGIDAVWDHQDSAAYTRLVAENHRLGYEDPATSELTEEELAAQQKTIKKRLDAMIEKLEYAKSRPQVWSRNLFWTGLVLAALGTLVHFGCPGRPGPA